MAILASETSPVVSWGLSLLALEVSGMLRTIVVRFQRLIPLVCEARRDLVDLWREREQLADSRDGLPPPDGNEGRIP